MALSATKQTFNLALQHHRAGRIRDAELLYRQILAQQPEHADAMHLLGVIAHQLGQHDIAADLIRRALVLNPRYAEAYNNLGNVLRDTGEVEEATAAYLKAISLKPDYADAHYNLGIALSGKAQFDQAIIEYRRAIAIRPTYAEAHNNLGIALNSTLQLDDAIAAYRRAIAVSPNYADAHGNLGVALKYKGQLDEAIAACRRAIILSPADAAAHNHLGNALKEAGQLDEAIAAYRQAVCLDPGNPKVDSNLIFALLYHPKYDAQSIADEHRRWDRQHAVPLPQFTTHSNDPTPGRPLRIGYVSPDFRDHVVGRNLLPLLRHHDRREFEVTCYAQVYQPDTMTGQFQQIANRWRDVTRLTDDEAADQIRQDSIDVLVDLALHTGRDRLLVFARKPAPVQATFAGYPGSTGLSAIDYRLSDPYLDPPGMDESIYSEKTIRLPDSFWCYDPMECRDIPVNSLPALSSGVITFGCLNFFFKINDDVLDLWAQVMRHVDNSRLLLLAPTGSPRARTLDRLRQAGIDPGRVEFVSHQSRQKYLETYHRIDVGLDTFPYNGHTTSLDSLWMGVPVVTLVGSRAVARAGWSQLSNLGLTELAAQSPEQFVPITVELASDLPRLTDLRRTLRQRMERSPLMDTPRFARNIEAAYRQMWRNWCEIASTKA